MDLDWTTVIFEIANFGILMLLLARFLFRPVRKVIAQRREEIEKTRVDAELVRVEGEATKDEYSRRTRELEAEADALRQAARSEGERAARLVVDAARAEMRLAHESVSVEIEQSRTEAFERIRPEIIELATEASRRLLQEIEAPDIAEAFARKGARRLREELTTVEGRPRVFAVTSPDADLYAVSIALNEILGDANVEVTVDPSLVGGVRLRAEGLEIDSSAGSSLDRWFSERRYTPEMESDSRGVERAP